MLLSLYIIIAIIVAAILVNRLVTSNAPPPPAHCPSRTGVKSPPAPTRTDTSFLVQQRGDVASNGRTGTFELESERPEVDWAAHRITIAAPCTDKK